MSMLSCIVYYFEYKLICRFVYVWLSPVRASSMILTNAWKVIVRYAFLTNIPRLSSMSHCINEPNGFFLSRYRCVGCYFSHIINERFGEETDGVCAWRSFFFLFLAFHLCRFCVVIRFFHHSHNGQSPPTGRFWFIIFILCASFQPLFSRRKRVINCASELDKLLKYKTSSSSYHTALHKSLQQEHVGVSFITCVYQPG